MSYKNHPYAYAYGCGKYWESIVFMSSGEAMVVVEVIKVLLPSRLLSMIPNTLKR